MELRQLEYFVAVADEASFTRAAAKMHVAQPGVSAQIRQLERELGQDLLDRSGRAVRLTAAGAAVLLYARAALGAAAGARLAVDELIGLVRGHVSVGMVVACSSFDLANLLADFHRDYPAVEIALSEANTDDLIEGLHAGRLDLAFVGLGDTTPPGIEIRLVADEPLVAAVSDNDVLAARKTITLEALGGRALMSLPRGTGLRSCLDDACARSGFEPNIALEASNLGILAQLAGRGLGVAILPESVALAHPEIHAIVITRPAMRGRLALAWRTEGPISPAARALIGRAQTGFVNSAADRQPAA
ncbi:MAG: LysR substrate-binding domain-containing protein [Candidatus Limnocylindrales bacterium]|jgi:DNA-binding transcriptional LysR family regulator